MDKEEKKRRTERNVAFYAALAVCLIAVGVGTWQLLQPGKAGQTAAVMGPEAPEGVTDAPQAVSGAAELPDADAPSASDSGVQSEAASGEAQSATASDNAQAAESSGKAELAGGASAANAKDAASAASSKDAASAASAKDKESASKSDGAGSASSAKGASNSKDSASKSKDTGSASKSKDSASSSKSAGSGKSSKDAGSGKSEQAKPSGGAVRPVEGAVVTAYSMDKLLYNETMRDWRTHDGIDIAADAGSAVVAAKAGTVESVTADPIMGTTVTIRHEGPWESVYASLTDAPEVEAGDDVAAGQVIGYVGQSAASESALGPHLHFAALNGGAPSDPEAFLS